MQNAQQRTAEYVIRQSLESWSLKNTDMSKYLPFGPVCREHEGKFIASKPQHQPVHSTVHNSHPKSDLTD